VVKVADIRKRPGPRVPVAQMPALLNGSASRGESVTTHQQLGGAVPMLRWLLRRLARRQPVYGPAAKWPERAAKTNIPPW
jgi:hypothetical protein